MHSRRIIPLCLAVVALSVSGCLNTRDIEGNDSGVFFPTLRFTIAPRGSDEVGGAEAAVDFEISRGSGDDSQAVAAGDQLALDDTQIPGPDVVDQDFAITVVSVAARGGFRSLTGLGIEGLVGFSYQNLIIELESPTRRGSEHISSFGLLLGGRLSLLPSEMIEIYGQATQTLGLGSSAFVGMSALEVAVSVTPLDNVGLILGWRWWDYRAEREKSVDDVFFPLLDLDASDIELELSGPLVALQIRF